MFDIKRVLQFVQRQYPKVGATARGSLESKLFRLPRDAKPEEVFRVVNEKLRASGYYDVRERDVLKEWQRNRIAQ